MIGKLRAFEINGIVVWKCSEAYKNKRFRNQLQVPGWP
jgi:hypothetical protein